MSGHVLYGPVREKSGTYSVIGSDGEIVVEGIQGHEAAQALATLTQLGYVGIDEYGAIFIKEEPSETLYFYDDDEDEDFDDEDDDAYDEEEGDCPPENYVDESAASPEDRMCMAPDEREAKRE